MLKPKKTKYRKYQKGTIKSSRKNVLFIDTLKEGVFRLDSQQSARITACLLYTSPSPRDVEESRMPSSA